ncbi:glycosyltransferase family 4 protein [Raineyella sp. W15-4]|uniref:glycosyltransferase family 4 protein n=1 Tax=Raineyella sp. W15-4 TaxID=3081651 RepID=UPI002953B09B|nr:glycosyltransferase family 4 protein [Raineyella sp. W15-4]WOQ16967.1 glycosyltransferase family 4 protein [Raineyella sp. W15-4]
MDFFNELGKTCRLTVLFEKARASNRDESWADFNFENFQGTVLHGLSYSADSAVSFEVLSYLRKQNYDAVVITNFSSPTGALAIAYLRSVGVLYYLESDGGFRSGGRIKTWLKKQVIRGADGYFSTSEENDKYFLAYGAKSTQLIRYPFTSIREKQILSEPPSETQRRAAREALGITQPQLVLSIGQFIPRKGFDVLLKAFALQRDGVALCIVGGEPTLEYLKLVESLQISNIYFVGFKQESELRTYFTAADLFVLPTREDVWGLVVSEALANSLPVVTTDRCISGLEMVAPNSCGLIVPAGNVDKLSEAIGRLLGDSELCLRMRTRALEVSREYTIERMARRHEHVLRERLRANA